MIGKGSIEKRDSDGFTWRLVICSGYDKKGKKLRQTRTVKVEGRTFDSRKKAAERQLSLFLAEAEKSDYVEPSKYTVESFSEKWLTEYAEKNLEDKTYLRYKELLQGRFCESIGHKKLQELKPVHLLDFYSNLQECGIRHDTLYVAKPEFIELMNTQSIDTNQLATTASISERTLNSIISGKVTSSAKKLCGAINKILADKLGQSENVKLDNIFTPASELKPLSNKTIQHYHKAISSMLNDAMQWQLISSNPATRVQPPKASKKDIACFNEDQAAILLEALEKEPVKYRALINLALSIGARRGELMGLEWKHIDMDKYTISIQQSVQYIPSEGLTLKQPKNKSSIRLISVPASTIALLKQYKLYQNGQKAKAGDAWLKDSDYVFTTWDGQLMHPDSVSSWFPEFIQRHNKTIDEDKSIPSVDKDFFKLPKTNFHALRHSTATLLINQGLNVRALSNRLGHANTSTTMNIYAHSLQSADKQAADLMESIITGKKNNQVEQKHA